MRRSKTERIKQIYQFRSSIALSGLTRETQREGEREREERRGVVRMGQRLFLAWASDCHCSFLRGLLPRTAFTNLLTVCWRGVSWLGIRSAITWIFLFATKIKPIEIRPVDGKWFVIPECMNSFSRFFFLSKSSHLTLQRSIMTVW